MGYIYINDLSMVYYWDGMVVSINGGGPNFLMVDFMENAIEIDENWG